MKNKKAIDFMTPKLKKYIYAPYGYALILGMMIFGISTLVLYNMTDESLSANMHQETLKNLNTLYKLNKDVFEARKEGRLIYKALKLDEEKISVKSDKDLEIYLIKLEDHGYELRSPIGEKLARVKYKSEQGKQKFNIYDPNGTKLFSGKYKKGTIRIKNNQGEIVEHLDGSYSTLSSSAFLLPIELQEHKEFIYEVAKTWIPETPEEAETED